MNFLKRLLCRHNWTFVKALDNRTDNFGTWKDTLWMCSHCCKEKIVAALPDYGIPLKEKPKNDAKVFEPVAQVAGIDEYGPLLEWIVPWYQIVRLKGSRLYIRSERKTEVELRREFEEWYGKAGPETSKVQIELAYSIWVAARTTDNLNKDL